MTDVTSQLTTLAAAPATGSNYRKSNWFEAFAAAWGNALDNQANIIEARSDSLSQGNDAPSQITMLTAEAMKMSFLSQSSHTSLDSVSKALETMARKG